jgi:hypothetical protein
MPATGAPEYSSAFDPEPGNKSWLFSFASGDLANSSALARERRRRRTIARPADEQDAAPMNQMTKITGLRVKLVSSFDSRFETLESVGGFDKSLQAQLGGKLRKVFSPPSPETTPDSVVRLLQQLEDKIARDPTR